MNAPCTSITSSLRSGQAELVPLLRNVPHILRPGCRLGREILVHKIYICVYRLGRHHRYESHLVTASLAFRQSCSGKNDDQMRQAVGIMVHAINA